MPRNIYNWGYDDVVSFLKQHFFIEVHIDSSHHYYRGNINNNDKLAHIQDHKGETINPKTLKNVIRQSGIPKIYWLKWAQAGNKKMRKKIQFSGARPIKK